MLKCSISAGIIISTSNESLSSAEDGAHMNSPGSPGTRHVWLLAYLFMSHFPRFTVETLASAVGAPCIWFC